MNSITIKINTANSAFDDNEEEEVIRILQEVISDLRDRKLQDINGNTCGSIAIN